MKSHYSILNVLLLNLLILTLAASCSSTTKTIDEGLSPPEFFQRAQEASDEGKNSLALQYYQTFQRVYPDEFERNLWASYEIAFLYYKMGQNEKALELFDELIAQYEAEESDTFPQGPKILAEKVKARIEEEHKKQ